MSKDISKYFDVLGKVHSDQQLGDIEFEVVDQSWYKEYIGQVKENGLSTDKHLFSFSDKTQHYDLRVKIAAMCDAPAICLMFPRYY